MDHDSHALNITVTKRLSLINDVHEYVRHSSPPVVCVPGVKSPTPSRVNEPEVAASHRILPTMHQLAQCQQFQVTSNMAARQPLL